MFNSMSIKRIKLIIVKMPIIVDISTSVLMINFMIIWGEPKKFYNLGLRRLRKTLFKLNLLEIDVGLKQFCF